MDASVPVILTLAVQLFLEAIKAALWAGMFAVAALVVAKALTECE